MICHLFLPVCRKKEGSFQHRHTHTLTHLKFDYHLWCDGGGGEYIENINGNHLMLCSFSVWLYLCISCCYWLWWCWLVCMCLRYQSVRLCRCDLVGMLCTLFWHRLEFEYFCFWWKFLFVFFWGLIDGHQWQDCHVLICLVSFMCVFGGLDFL